MMHRDERCAKHIPTLPMEEWMKTAINTCTPKVCSAKPSVMLSVCGLVLADTAMRDITKSTMILKMPFAPLLGCETIFSGNDSGAEDNYIFYTLIGSCLQAGVDLANGLLQH